MNACAGVKDCEVEKVLHGAKLVHECQSVIVVRIEGEWSFNRKETWRRVEIYIYFEVLFWKKFRKSLLFWVFMFKDYEKLSKI